MFDVIFLCWAALVVVGAMLSVKGARQGNTRKQALGRRLLLVAGASVLVGIAAMVYLVAVAGSN